MADQYILVINPGSTSTKLGLFRGAEMVAEDNAEGSSSRKLWDTVPERLEAINAFLTRNGAPKLAACVGRGGLIHPVQSGTIRVNDAMVADVKAAKRGEHASNLGCALADAIARPLGIPAFIVDSVAVDELNPLARHSGHPLIQRESLSHALNLHAVTRKAAEKIGKPLAETRFVVAHLGGGISVAAMEGGREIDTNNAIADGPFAPNRTGGLPIQALIKLCYAGTYTLEDWKRMTVKEGGLKAYLGTDDGRDVEKMIDAGDERAREIYEAMAYQIAKEIGAMATVHKGKVDAIVITGGLAKDKRVAAWVTERVSFIAPVHVFGGSFEMEALALGALRVLQGQEQAMEYVPE